MAIVTIFREPILQGFHLLGHTTVLLTQLLNQDVLLPEQRLLLDHFPTPHQLLLFSITEYLATLGSVALSVMEPEVVS